MLHPERRQLRGHLRRRLGLRLLLDFHHGLLLRVLPVQDVPQPKHKRRRQRPGLRRLPDGAEWRRRVRLRVCPGVLRPKRGAPHGAQQRDFVEQLHAWLGPSGLSWRRRRAADVHWDRRIGRRHRDGDWSEPRCRCGAGAFPAGVPGTLPPFGATRHPATRATALRSVD